MNYLETFIPVLGCLAPLVAMVIPGSQYSNFISNIFCNQHHVCKARVQIKTVVVVGQFLRPILCLSAVLWF